MKITFRTTSYFDKKWRKMGGTNSDVLKLSEYLLERGPKDIEPVSKYTRVVRAAIGGKGKRGGARVIYFAELAGFVFFIGCYDRRKKVGLTKEEKTSFDALCEELLRKYR